MKISSRVVGATVGLVLALSTVACTASDSDPGQAATAASPSATPTATVDPASALIPIDGDSDVPIEWSTDGVDLGDPVVVVARRDIALRYLASDSRSWTDRAKLTSALDPVSKNDEVARHKFGQAAKADPVGRKPLPGPYRVLLMPPTPQGDTVGVDACVDINEAFPAPPGSGFDEDTAYDLQRLTLQVVDGSWKVTKRGHEYAGGPGADPKLEKLCTAFTTRS